MPVECRLVLKVQAVLDS